MDGAWPEFVKETEGEAGRRRAMPAELTGWETVVFVLQEAEKNQEPCSVFSTAAAAP